MKKFLIKIICGILLIPFLESCQDLLKEENIRVPVADMYYKTGKGYTDLVNACYPPLRNLYGGYNMFQMNVLGTDLWLNGGDGSRNLGFYNTLTPSDGALWGAWQDLYSGISTCNTAIDRAAELPASAISEAKLNVLLGEAHFLRAFYYHLLVMQWGGVPLELNEITAVKTTAVRATEQQVYDQIIKDLLSAEQLLPATQVDYGRATKPAAQALLARVYLWNNKNAEAATYAKKVINDYSFKLLNNYSDLWKMSNQHNTEVIFAVPFTLDVLLGGIGNPDHHLFLCRYDIEKGMVRDIANGRPFRHYMPSRHLMDICQANRWRDSRFDKAYTTVWYANNPSNLLPEMKLGDTALFIPPYAVSQKELNRTAKKYTTRDIDFYFDATTPNGWSPKGARQTFPSLNKFLDPERISVASSMGSKDFFVIRLAEMYLIAAEALMKTGKADEGVNFINVVRLRAAWPGKENDMKLTASQLTIEAILDERAFELAGECVGRWPDLKRTGKLLEYVRRYNPDASPNIKESNLLRPIPQNMIDRITNKDEFPQNPGY